MARTIIEKKLAACSNVFPIQSTYFWNGILEQGQEYVLLLKTLPALEVSLRKVAEVLHAYDTPCLMSWTVNVNDAYGKWVEGQVTIEHQQD
jgi:periplasmic divalent cation tolerance protein